jgi:hypothetical protein
VFVERWLNIRNGRYDMQISLLNGQKRRFLALTATASIAAAVIGSAVGVSSAVGSDPLSRPVSELNPVDVVSALGQQSRSSASIDTAVSKHFAELGDGGIVASSARLISESDGARYWVAVDEANNICLVTLFVDADLAGSNCGASQDVEKWGISQTLSGDPSSAAFLEKAAVLLPDSAAIADTSAADLPDEWDVLTPNLMVADSSDISENTVIEIERSGSQDKVLELEF